MSNHKTILCDFYNTSNGCKFGNRCNFAHGNHELKRNTPYIAMKATLHKNNHDGWVEIQLSTKKKQKKIIVQPKKSNNSFASLSHDEEEEIKNISNNFQSKNVFKRQI